MLILVLCGYVALLKSVVGINAASSRKEGIKPSHRVLFASCNRQSQPQSFWKILKKFQPDAFIWTGDSVYAKDNTIAKLDLAYETLLENESYRDFAKSTRVMGTWDDHGEVFNFMF